MPYLVYQFLVLYENIVYPGVVGNVAARYMILLVSDNGEVLYYSNEEKSEIYVRFSTESFCVTWNSVFPLHHFFVTFFRVILSPIW